MMTFAATYGMVLIGAAYFLEWLVFGISEKAHSEVFVAPLGQALSLVV
jgi:hypothetical protein